MGRSIEDRRKLVEDNVRLVGYFAGKNRKPPGISFDDWLAELRLSLVKSAKYWSGKKGANFASYALVGMELVRRSRVQKARMVKHQVLKQFSQFDEDMRPVLDRNDGSLPPDELAIISEECGFARSILRRLQSHNPTWHVAVRERISGKSFEEIASNKRLRRTGETVRQNYLRGIRWMASQVGEDQ